MSAPFYKCQTCGYKTFNMDSDTCLCGEQMERGETYQHRQRIGAPAVIFKGDGFPTNDMKREREG